MTFTVDYNRGQTRSSPRHNFLIAETRVHYVNRNHYLHGGELAGLLRPR